MKYKFSINLELFCNFIKLQNIELQNDYEHKLFNLEQ